MSGMGEALALAATAVGLAAVWVAWLGSRSTQEQATLARLSALERRIQAIMDHLEIVDPLPRPDLSEVQRHLDAGRKIPAIKAYREVTGAGLKEAKDEVEAMERRRPA
jgi:ribosomal protein L7/L12